MVDKKNLNGKKGEVVILHMLTSFIRKVWCALSEIIAYPMKWYMSIDKVGACMSLSMYAILPLDCIKLENKLLHWFRFRVKILYDICEYINGLIDVLNISIHDSHPEIGNFNSRLYTKCCLLIYWWFSILMLFHRLFY